MHRILEAGRGEPEEVEKKGKKVWWAPVFLPACPEMKARPVSGKKVPFRDKG